MSKARREREQTTWETDEGINRGTNICFDCAKAIGRCSWAKSFQPVEGWTAEESIVPSNYTGSGYHVKACPEYEQDTRGKNRKRKRPPASEMDTDNCLELLSAAMKLAKKDYIHGNTEQRFEVACFIWDWIRDSKPVLDRLKKAAAEHDRAMIRKAREARENI